MLKQLLRCAVLAPLLFMSSCYTSDIVEICPLPPQEDCQNYIVFGVIHRDSCNAACRELYLLTKYRLYRASNNQFDEVERTQFGPSPMANGMFQKAEHLFDPPIELTNPKQHPRVIHNPDDRQDLYWQFQRGGQRITLRFDELDATTPQSVRGYMQQMQAMVKALRWS